MTHNWGSEQDTSLGNSWHSSENTCCLCSHMLSKSCISWSLCSSRLQVIVQIIVRRGSEICSRMEDAEGTCVMQRTETKGPYGPCCVQKDHEWCPNCKIKVLTSSVAESVWASSAF